MTGVKHYSLWGVTLLFFALLALSCSTQTRYEVLSFFFDGVPEPQSEKTQDEETATTATLVVDAGQSDESSARRRPSLVPHQKIDRSLCSTCHASQQGALDARPISGKGICQKCHGDRLREEGWNHGPINIGQCSPCHMNGHQSAGPYLLSRPTVKELCHTCHDGNKKKSEMQHRAQSLRISVEDCMACHDPHKVY